MTGVTRQYRLDRLEIEGESKDELQEDKRDREWVKATLQDIVYMCIVYI